MKKKANSILNSRTFHENDGFATLTMMLFLPVICLILFSFAFISYVIQHKTKLRSHCLTETIAIEKKLIQNEENLFKLNDLAFSLRLRMNAALAERDLALIAENPFMVAHAEIKIQQITIEQLRLDSIQKSLIRSAKIQLKLQTAQLLSDLSKLSSKTNSNWSYYLEAMTTVVQLNETKMAVKPDSPDVAPAYELDSNYKQLQTVAYKWQQLFRSKSKDQGFLKSENIFEMSCSSTAEKKGSQWQILINADKF